MRIEIPGHALIHGGTGDQIRAAFTPETIEKRSRHRDRKADPPRRNIIGIDNQARALELIAVELSVDILIIHANYLRPGFAQEMRNLQ